MTAKPQTKTETGHGRTRSRVGVQLKRALPSTRIGFCGLSGETRCILPASRLRFSQKTLSACDSSEVPVGRFLKGEGPVGDAFDFEEEGADLDEVAVGEHLARLGRDDAAVEGRPAGAAEVVEVVVA